MSDNSNDELQAKLDQVKKDISSSRREQPDVPPSATNQEKANMAKKTKSSEDKTSKKSKKADKAAASNEEGGYTATQLAAALKIESTELRKALRDIGAEKPGGRWIWANENDKGLLKIRTQLEKHLATPKTPKISKAAKNEDSDQGKAKKKGKNAKASDAAPADAKPKKTAKVKKSKEADSE